MTTLVPGTLLQDRYRIVRPIGQGGMGAVYEAIQERLKRRVAVKQLLIVNEARRTRAFLREAQILANLEHRSLPDIIDYFTDDVGHFLVMDFIPGDDLAVQLAQRGSPFPTDQVLQWADQVLDVLEYLHTQHPEPIYHGDIKPHNLKLKPSGEIMLLDFGIAKGHLPEMTHVSGDRSIVGYTPGFSPPEQVEGLGMDGRSDLYALGATLHRLLTNTPPVDERSRWRAVARGRQDPLRPVHELNSLVSRAVSAVIVQAVALEPEDRPASAVAMRAALQAAVEPIQLEERSRSSPGTAPVVKAEELTEVDVVFSQSATAGEPGSRDHVPSESLAVEPLAPEAELTQVDEPLSVESDKQVVVGDPLLVAPPDALDEAIVQQPDEDVDVSVSERLPGTVAAPAPAEATVHAAEGAPQSDVGHPTPEPNANPRDAQLTAMPEPTIVQAVVEQQSQAEDALSAAASLMLPSPAAVEAEPLAAEAGGQILPIGDHLVSNPTPPPDSVIDEREFAASADLSTTLENEHQIVIDARYPTHLTLGPAANATPLSLPASFSTAKQEAPATGVASNMDASDRRDETGIAISVAGEKGKPGTTMVEAKPRAKRTRYWEASGAAFLLVVLGVFVLRGPSVLSLELTPQATVQPTTTTNNPVVLPSTETQTALVTPTPTVLATATAVPDVCTGDELTEAPTGSAQDHHQRGLAALEAGNFDQAIREYSWSIQLDPHVDAYIGRGHAYHAQEKYDCSITDYNRGLQLDPQSVEAHISRGQAYHMKARYDSAIQDYNHALELDPNSVVAYNFRGNAYSFQEKYDHAIQDYTRAIELYSDYEGAYFNRGLVYTLKGSDEYKEKAIADFQKVVALNGKLRQRAEEQLRELDKPPTVTTTS